MARPFQFRLRTIFVLTAMAAVACLVGPPAVKEYRDQQRRKEMEIYFRVGNVRSGGYIFEAGADPRPLPAIEQARKHFFMSEINPPYLSGPGIRKTRHILPHHGSRQRQVVKNQLAAP